MRQDTCASIPEPSSVASTPPARARSRAWSNGAASGRYYEISPEHMLLGLVQRRGRRHRGILQYFRKDRLKCVGGDRARAAELRTGNAGRPVFAENLFNWFENAWVTASLERGSVPAALRRSAARVPRCTGRYTAESFDELDADRPRRAAQGVRRHHRRQPRRRMEVPPQVERGRGAPGVRARPGARRWSASPFRSPSKARQGEIDPIFGRDARDPADDRHPGAPAQEQPDHRGRAGRRQDRAGRGAGAGDRRQGGARRAAATSSCSGSTWGCSRPAPACGASSRTGSRR